MRGSKRVCYVTSFAVGLDFMKRGDQKYPVKVLRCLDKCKRFSIFEATANQTIARTMSQLVERGYIDVDNSPGYPWSNVKLTDKGREYLDTAP